MIIDFDRLTKNFLLNEGEAKRPSVYSYIQSLTEIINNLNPRSQTDTRRLQMAKEHLKEIKRHARRLEERVFTLEEHVKILEEDKK
jgi:hypothetical protein